MTANGQDLCFTPNVKQHLSQHSGLQHNTRSSFQRWCGENSHLVSPRTAFHSAQVTWPAVFPSTVMAQLYAASEEGWRRTVQVGMAGGQQSI